MDKEQQEKQTEDNSSYDTAVHNRLQLEQSKSYRNEQQKRQELAMEAAKKADAALEEARKNTGLKK